ncbi:hypothetical protein [uncultured Rubinisphaera sp.]|uniref:hypothetical protein n=1 Tax=uncultured Rubinisphaera sp. TaxID=1678686 RepID=UPI0030DAE1EF
MDDPSKSPELENLGSKPMQMVLANLAYQVLGPTAAYLGDKGQQYTSLAIENIERIFNEAKNKMSEEQQQSGQVPPRLLKTVLNEGALVEDQVAASYLGGVLASSKTGFMRDDRGVAVNAMISRLSVFQLRLHFILYASAHYLFRGMEINDVLNKVKVGQVGLMYFMGVTSEELADNKFNYMSILHHSLLGLDREGLISHWEFLKTDELECTITDSGIELYLWACGKGNEVVDYFYDPAFELPEMTSEDDFTLIPGSNVLIKVEGSDEEVRFNGFDYSREMSRRALICLLENRKTNTSNQSQNLK